MNQRTAGISRKAITQQQIAAASNLSIATVSAVLSGKASLRRIAPETVEQVWKVSRELGYQPAVRTEARNIGIILRRGVRYALSNPFYGEIYDGIDETLRGEDYHTIFSNPFESSIESAGIPQIVTQSKVAGVILLGQIEEDYIQRLCEFGTRLVTVNFACQQSVPSVMIDGLKEKLLAMDYLKSQGHSQIAYLSTNYGTQYSRALEQGYRQGLPAGVRPLVLNADRGGDVEHGVETMSAYLKTHGRDNLPFTCVLAENDTLAAGAVLALQAAGLAVPQDMSVMGGQDLYLPYPLQLSLTTTASDRRYMGETAARLLLNLLSREQHSPIRVTLDASLVTRGSVQKIG